MNSKIRLFCFSLLLLWSISSSAQLYLSPQFSEVSRDSFIYARYGSDTLKLDLYQAVGDSNQQKPVLLYVHGGGFAGGTRDGERTEQFAHYMAQRGYCMISMSYRLTMKGRSFSCDQPASNKIATFLAAMQDIRKAVQFTLDRKEEWGIDPSKIVLAGSSAGAEAVLHEAFWPKEMLSDSMLQLPPNFRYAGVISLAGAMVDDEMINHENAIPTLLFHGTCDNLVPYATAPHHYCSPGNVGYMILDGAKSIADRLASLGKPYYLFTACQGQHEWADVPMEDYQQHFAEFMYQDVIKGKFRQVHEVIRMDGEGCDYHSVEFPYCH